MLLKRFFVVTTTSIYEVVDNGLVHHPSVKKIALKGESSLSVGETLESAEMVSIGSQIITFVPTPIPGKEGDLALQREIGLISPRFRGGNTSIVVALFLTEIEARSCFEQNSQEKCDPRWVVQTRSVLEAIGNNHPKFSISHTPEMALMAV